MWLLTNFQTDGAARSVFFTKSPPQLFNLTPYQHLWLGVTTAARYLCRSPVCVWRSCGPQPPPPPSAPPGSPGYSGRQPPAPAPLPAPLPHRRTDSGAAAEGEAGEARTKQPERPGRAAAARWGPSPRAGARSGGSRSVLNRIQSPAAASEDGYCPGSR